MSFENYECDGQMSFLDLYPKECCGVKPWLHQTKCWMDGRDDIPQQWIMNYECPRCHKVPVGVDHWTIHSKGTFEEAAQKALEVWNNPETLFECKDWDLHFPCSRKEEFEETYGIEWKVGVKV